LIKVLDFGLASIVFKGQVILRPCGSLAFSSPEIVRKTYYDQKTDVWSLGVVLYSILTQRLPFFRINPDETKHNILRQEITFNSKHWAVISPKAKDLIAKMLCKDPSKRYSMEEVISHPWFDVLNNKEGAVGTTQPFVVPPLVQQQRI
jgi:serine/threonine protein kinase